MKMTIRRSLELTAVLLLVCSTSLLSAADLAEAEAAKKEAQELEKQKKAVLEKEWNERRDQFWKYIYNGMLAEATEVKVYKTIEGTDLRIYIFRPKAPKDPVATPAILFIHGGGWGGGDASEFAPYCRYLASRGMVAMSLEYRFHSKKYTPPQALSNTKTAIRWLRKNAKELKINPDKLAVGGSSAGGHLAAAAAALDGFDEPGEDISVSARPDALVLLSAVIDITDAGYVNGGKTIRKMGMDPEMFSPFQHIKPGFPPTFFQYAVLDPGVGQVGPRFEALMKKNGDVCQMLVHEKGWHGSQQYHGNSGTCFTDTVLNIDKFLVSQGFLSPGEPAITMDTSVTLLDPPPPRKALADLGNFSPVGQWKIANAWQDFKFRLDGSVAAPDGKTGKWKMLNQQLLYTWPDGTEVNLPVISSTEIEFPMNLPPSRNGMMILKKQ